MIVAIQISFTLINSGSGLKHFRFLDLLKYLSDYNDDPPFFSYKPNFIC